MPLKQLFGRSTTLGLVLILSIEVALVVSLHWLGWIATTDTLTYVACLTVFLLPLLAATAILVRRSRTFSLAGLLSATMLVAMFLAISLLPLARHRSARKGILRLLSANVTVNEGLDLDDYYAQIGLEKPQTTVLIENSIPPWIAPLANKTAALPADDAVTSIRLDTDKQCQVFADNSPRFTSLQSVLITDSVSLEGFRMLEQVLPQFEHLDCVRITSPAAPDHWYGALTNVRTLMIYNYGQTPNMPFEKTHLKDIARLANLEVLTVSGYAFTDDDARTLATSTSIKRVALHRTAVTAIGESDLANEERVVYRE